MLTYCTISTIGMGSRSFTLKAKSLSHATTKIERYLIKHNWRFLSIKASISPDFPEQDQYMVSINNKLEFNGQWLAL